MTGSGVQLRRRMLCRPVVALMLIATIRAAPISAEDASPLPRIGSTRTSPECRALRTYVAPSVAAILTNDQLLTSTAAVLKRMATTAGDSSEDEGSRQAMDRHTLGILVVGLARNIHLLDTIPREARRTESEEVLARVRDEIAAVADQQREALDQVSGLLETELEGQMRSEFDAAMANAVAPTNGKPASIPPPLVGSGLVMKEPLSVFDQRKIMTNSTVFGHTLYDSLARTVGSHRIHVDRLEKRLSGDVVEIVDRCRQQSAQQQETPPQP